MPQYTSVDPGNNTGWAVFHFESGMPAPVLEACGLAQEGGKKYPPLEGRPGFFLVELPQVYTSQKSKGDPNDLIALAALAGQYRERFARAGAKVGHVVPREWKGTIDPDIVNNRTLADLARMGNGSLENYLSHTKNVAPSLLHNVLDGVGIGLAAFRKGLWPR
jgi:hypothetical protein